MPPETSAAGLGEFLATHGPLLASLHACAGAAHWNVSSQEFAARLCRSAAYRFGSVNHDPREVQDYLQALHLEDLALACALQKGSVAAWEDFVKSYRPILYAAARSLFGAGQELRAHDLADSLYAELYGLNRSNDLSQRSLLAYFHGRSRLSTWLRSVLAQRHVDELRSSKRMESLDDTQIDALSGKYSERGIAVSSAGAAARTESSDPDRARLLPHLAKAVSESLAALPAADRLLLRLYYVQGMTLAQIARIQNFHEATASRRLEAIRQQVRLHVEQVLTAGSAGHNGHPRARALSPAEVRACLGYALEDWSFDLAGALQPDSAPEAAGGE